MKVSKKDIRILLMFLGIAFLALAYFKVYTPQMEKAEALEIENAALQRRLEELTAMNEDRAFYEDEIRRMTAEISTYCDTFPAAVKEEDGILLANSMEKKIDMQISSVGLGEPVFVTSIKGTVPAEAERKASSRQNLSQRGAQSTMDAINEIEGTNEKLAVGTVDGTEMPSKPQFIHDEKWNPVLYRNQDTMQFVTDYKGLKRAVKFLNAQVGRMTVDSISAVFDSSTGNLSGSMSVNLFSMTDTGAVYSEPSAGNVRHGTKNIFGTIETAGRTKNNH